MLPLFWLAAGCLAMPDPTDFPVWMTAPDGVTDLLVMDVYSYRAQVKAGATFDNTAPPVHLRSTTGAYKLYVGQVSINKTQPLPSGTKPKGTL